MLHEVDPEVPHAVRDGIAEDCLTVMKAMHAFATPAVCRMDITMSQVKAMLTVSMRGELSVGEVARVMGIGNPAASTLVERLVTAGWVARTEDPIDRRRALVRLTPAGREQVDAVWRLRGDVLNMWIDLLPTADVLALARGIGALREVSAGTEPQVEPMHDERGSYA